MRTTFASDRAQQSRRSGRPEPTPSRASWSRRPWALHGRLDDGTPIYSVKARELGRKGIVVGDRVDIVGDTSGDTDTQGRIVRRHERHSTLRRTAEDTDPVERIIVANATRLAVVTSTVDPEPRIGLIDRALVAAYDAGIEPMLVLTKTDLKPADELVGLYGPLDVPLHLIAGKKVPDDLRAALAGEMTVLVGHSGVGKSTLVNNLVPSADRSTGVVNVVTGKGRHTSTSVEAIHLPQGGWIIDTPGIRSFGLAHVDPARVIKAFPDLDALTSGCPRGCTHDEEECALNDVTSPEMGVRVDSLRRLIRSRSVSPDEEFTAGGRTQ
jgi:ribosome biogenesis GTPase